MVRQSRLPPILLTRPAAAADRLAGQIMAHFGMVQIVSSPLLSLAPVPFTIPEAPFSSLIFTSEAAVAAWATIPYNPDSLPPKRAWCVGPRTAEAARDLGLSAQSAEGDAQALLDLILSSNDFGPFLHLHGRETRGNIAARLQAAGRSAHDIVAYDQIPQPLLPSATSLLLSAEPVLAPVFSPRTAQLLGAERRRLGRSAPLWFVALSSAVAAALTLYPDDRIAISETPDTLAVIRALERLLGNAT